MKFKIWGIFFVLIGFSVSVFAVKVATDELKGAKKVEFINYTGEPKKKDSFADLKRIGDGLAAASKNTVVRYFLKYSVIHAISKGEAEKFDADIFSIDKESRTNHIRDVRYILSSYFQKRYGYSEKDARILAVFVTYYNAVYRGDLNYFSQKYKKAVLKYVSAGNAGIALKYSEWPGKTRMMVPLTFDEKKGSVSSLDPNEISDKKVIESIRTEKDKGVSDRREMVKLREKDLEKKKDSIEAKKDKINEKKEDMGEKESQLKEKKAELDKKKAEAEKKEKELKKEEDKTKAMKDSPEKEKKEKELEEKKKDLEKDKIVIGKEEIKIKKEEKKLEEKKEEVKKEESQIKKKEEEISKKEQEINKEKSDIKKDERDLLIQKQPKDAQAELNKQKEELEKKEKQLEKREEQLKQGQADKNIFAGKLYYLKIKEYTTDGHYDNELLMINAADKKVEFKSKLGNICGKKYDVFKDGVVVIADQGQHKSAHNLVLVDKEKLEPQARSKENIFWRSFVEIRDDFIYAIVIDKGSYYLGKFDSSLKNVILSKEKIHEDSFISFFGDLIYINGENKQIIVLSKQDLVKIGEIQP